MLDTFRREKRDQ